MRFVKSFWLIPCLLLALSACSDSMYSEKEVYYFGLGMAQQSGNDICFIMDDSLWIDTQNDLSDFSIETGKRYHLYYRLLEYKPMFNKKERHKAELLDAQEVPVLPIGSQLSSENSGQGYQSIDVDRIWMAGGYLNISYACWVNQSWSRHYTQMIQQSYGPQLFQLKLYHFPYAQNSDHNLTKRSFYLSFPLSEIRNFDAKTGELALSIYENEQWVVYHLKP